MTWRPAERPHEEDFKGKRHAVTSGGAGGNHVPRRGAGQRPASFPVIRRSFFCGPGQGRPPTSGEKRGTKEAFRDMAPCGAAA